MKLALQMVASFTCGSVVAEVAMDGTLGTPGALSGPAFAIPADLGRKIGPNLFHSFSRLDLVSSESATFSGPLDTQNIVARVTGGAVSSIDGILRSNIAGANLFLMNPSGILLGPNARLDVTGSFVATTADFISFGITGRFNAATPTDDVLTSAPPEAFGFLRPAPASITVQGFLAPISGKNLALIGGDLRIDRGNLVVRSGRLHLASVRSQGVARLDIRDSGAIMNTDEFAAMGNVTALNRALITAGSGDEGGSLVIRAGRLSMNSARFMATKASRVKNEGIDIRLRTALSLTRGSAITASSFGDFQNEEVLRIDAPDIAVNASEIFVETSSLEGSAGGLKIVSSRVQLLLDGNLLSHSAGGANGGFMDVNADSLTLSLGSGIISTAEAAGSGGAIHLNLTGKLDLSIGSVILADTAGSGTGGAIDITANSLSVGGFESFIASTTGTTASGRGGDLHLRAIGAIDMLAGAQIFAGTEGQGSGGNLEIATDTLSLGEGSRIAVAPVNQAGVFGALGTLRLDAASELRVLSGSQIVSSTISARRGGDAHIKAGSLLLSGTGSSIATQTSGILPDAGPGGDLSLEITGALTVSEGGILGSTTRGLGKGGDFAGKLAGHFNFRFLDIHLGSPLGTCRSAPFQLHIIGLIVHCNINLALHQFIHMNGWLRHSPVNERWTKP